MGTGNRPNPELAGTTSATPRVPPDWGTPLADADYAALEASWISREMADAAMLRRVNTVQGREVIAHKGRKDYAGILYSFYLPGADRPHSYRLRRDNPEFTQDKEGKLKPRGKYLAAPNSGNRLYFPPGVTLEQLADATIPIVLCEGEKKALALQQLATYKTDRPRFIPVAITGVWNWRGKTGKGNGPRGERIDLVGPINDLDLIVWPERLALILFDANVSDNPSVRTARKRFASELATRRSKVQFIDLPPDCGVNGVDDLLALWGPDRALKLFETPTPATGFRPAAAVEFQRKAEGMFRTCIKGGDLIETQVANFQAAVVTSICLDDGVEKKREFEIQAELAGRQHSFAVPAAQFSEMDWAIEQMGPFAMILPNQKHYALAAVQYFSASSEERSVYTHTGWRKDGEQWIFLHAGGAIGADGAVEDVSVRPHGALSRFELRLPPTPEALTLAVDSSLRILQLGPRPVCFLLFAAPFLAVVGEPDVAIHIVGATGAFKSELAALVQQFFGAQMVRWNLPCTWSSTPNSIEVLAFHGKDVIVVVDDFAPQGNASEVARYHGVAARVFRAVGNRAGRNRLNSNSLLREPKPPRALILSTGEDIPMGQSIRARLLIAEVAKGDISSARLSVCQEDARGGRYAEVMAAFLQWMARGHDEVITAFRERVKKLREELLRNPAHARTPDAIGSLMAAFELFLEFAESRGAIRADLREYLRGECRIALCKLAADQGKHQEESEPATHFLTVLRACLSSGQAHLPARAGGVPNRSPESCGWRSIGGSWQGQGYLVGWVDGEDVYIDSTAAYQVVQAAVRNANETLPTLQIVRKRLHERGFLASVDKPRESLMVRRLIGGSSHCVLHLRRDTVLPDDADDGTPDSEDLN